MKKIIALMIILLIALPFSLAKGNSENDNQKQVVKELPIIKEKSQVRGLENAMLRVRNEETKQHIERVMNMIQEKQRERLNKLENLEFDTDIVDIEGTEDEAREVVIATGLEEKKFLGLFKVKRKATYEIKNTGQIMKRSRFFGFLYLPV